MAIEVTYGSKMVKTRENADILYLVTTNSKNQFWSHESLRGGLIVDVTHRVAGEKYTDREGKEQLVKKSGLNFNYLIGTKEDAREIQAAKLAVAECEL